MKMHAIPALTSLLFSLFFWHQEAESVEPPSLQEEIESSLVEIECSLTPIDRSMIPSSSIAHQVSSLNRGGYYVSTALSDILAANSVSYVAGSWTVPTLLSTPDTSYCNIWVGMDGFSNPAIVERIGTSHNWIGCAQVDFAWFEVSPNGAYRIDGFPLDKGDVISVRIGYKGNNTFKLVLNNLTKGVSTVAPVTHTMNSNAFRSSAAWIIETPSINGNILPLANFQIATFNYCSAIINGINGAINDDHWMRSVFTMFGDTGIRAQPGFLK